MGVIISVVLSEPGQRFAVLVIVILGEPLMCDTTTVGPGSGRVQRRLPFRLPDW